MISILLNMETAILDLQGATCTSCSIGIEHMGRRIKGVENIDVHRGSGEIHLEWDGNPATVEKIQGFVQAIGYEATLRE
jgi:cation transport ATPase